MTERTLSTVYDPKSVESRIYEVWERGGHFAPREGARGTFSIVMPPPNVTGVLHLGHALDTTLQDIATRFRRMQGYSTLWVPGTDHAGIATQARVEQALREEEGKSRYDLGREAFVERVWAWKEQYGGTITSQIRSLGASCDWSRERFTMDPGLSRAVREVFVRLYEEGLIYRGNRIINWCPRCRTALSDIEVEHIEEPGVLYHVRYPLEDGSGHLVIATTRPETMFADVAVAVHPDDERYASYVGKTIRLPLTDRTIPVIADTYVERDFGTGCLKITPAHDPNDFEVGERHHLPSLVCLDQDGRLTDLAGRFAGLSREEGRERVVEALREEGYLVKEEPLDHAVGHCDRCGTVVEPYLSEQWFVRMEPLAQDTLERARRGELRFLPDRFMKVFEQWLTNVRDWCISRQLWWGHRIPAWYCGACGQVSVSRDDLDHCLHCGSQDVQQDEDVLDTWFSSALWPFSTMGWPERTPDLARFYPTSLLVTGYDILFFWVARMAFMGVHFTGQMPFETVLLHGLLRDAKGQKMSKSKGNGIDPMDVIDKYGADALRFMLASNTVLGNDLRFSWEKVEGARNFLNKLWNAARFVLMNLDEGFSLVPLDAPSLDLADRFILHRLGETIRRATSALEDYDVGEAARAVYEFTWDEFCDWYIEFAKINLYGDRAEKKRQTQTVLITVLSRVLALLHPYIPFITEEIWQALPNTTGMLIDAAWPDAADLPVDERAVEQMRAAMEIIRAVRNVRSELQIPPKTSVPIVIGCDTEGVRGVVNQVTEMIARFCNAERVDVGAGIEPPKQAAVQVVTGAKIYIPLAGLIDMDAERERLKKEANRLKGEVERLEKKLANANFVQRAPQEVVAQEREKLADYRAKLSAVEERMASLEG
ncbi:valine--tRNA ligase [Alicyclobacillus sendaiensis]|uniref:Valine--tRNA ligase n=1 Tax=Alicyclobacillus sendaiensis PA2 TaxID=3029425 RepID=A0ABT6XXN7_ALISE|nr:valine--tRNA ligase [Alicyclobacillus sendaiensis]MDI9259858.1 valine--tRNA ligase [Alicyclobacillus sendaiensis PA2]